MKFIPTPLSGAWLIELDKFKDERGWFARSWCQREFAEHGLDSRLVQCNLSFNKKLGTLRGLHYQAAPYAESKLVRCISGAIYDVIVDLRQDSDTYLQWVGYELTADNDLALFIPMGFAHGFQTLEDESTVFYQMSEFYVPESSRGLRYNDPLLNIDWPVSVGLINERDRSYPNYSRELFPELG